MSIKKVFKPIENFIKKIARYILTQELLQTELRHEREIEALKELFRKHMQLLYSPTISIFKNRDLSEDGHVVYSATFVVPNGLTTQVPKAEMSVSRELVEKTNSKDFLLYIAKDLVAKLFEEIKTRAKYISD